EYVFRLLLEKGVDVHFCNTKGFSALWFAVHYHKPKFVRLLVEKGADVNCQDNHGETPLLQAVDNIEILSFLLENGADVNFRSGFESRTPLECAVVLGHEDCVRLLLDKGAGVNLRNEMDETPL
ncbi:ankyrin repeat-containing domain protein, partial [Pyronema domesticum]